MFRDCPTEQSLKYKKGPTSFYPVVGPFLRAKLLNGDKLIVRHGDGYAASFLPNDINW